MLNRFLKVHAGTAVPTANPQAKKSKDAPNKGKVGIVACGGSGPKPGFTGYPGKNLVDAIVAGEIFSSPTAKSFYDTIKAADSLKGVAVLPTKS